MQYKVVDNVKIILKNAMFYITSFLLLYKTWYMYKPTVFLGDDLSVLFSYKDGLFATGFINVISGIEHAYDKYRPLFVLMLSIELSIFQNNLNNYFLFNIAICSLSILIVLNLVRKIAPNLPKDVVFLILILLSTSRFLAYHITQVLGTLEHLSQLLALLSLNVLYTTKHIHHNAVKIPLSNIVWSLVFASLSVLVHERYVTIFIGLCVIFYNNISDSHYKKPLVVLSFSICIITLFGRSWITGIPTFVGTGGQLISIKFSDIFHNSSQGFISILGLNWGPEHLIGANFLQIGYFANIHMFFIICMLVNLYFHRIKMWTDKSFLCVVEASLVGFVLSIPPILTIRMEQRWEYFPFIMLILAISVASSIISKTMTWWIVRGYFVSYLIINMMYLSNFSNLYMVYASNVAVKFHDLIISNPRMFSRYIYFISGTEHCGWTFQEQNFALLYINQPIKPQCINPQEISPEIEESAQFIIMDYNGKFIIVDKYTIITNKPYIVPVQPGNIYKINTANYAK